MAMASFLLQPIASWSARSLSISASISSNGAVPSTAKGRMVVEIPLDNIRRPLMRTRANDQQKVKELMDSISEIGLQVPIDVLEVDGVYYGFSGCHRYEAHQKLGLPTIRCKCLVIIVFLIVSHATTCLSGEELLSVDYYKETCPYAEEIVRREVEIALIRDPRMAASLLRLHFHDCFVLGCDASLLLDDFGDIVSEKLAGPNNNSLRGFEVLDRIKFLLEAACPYTVSCADIIAIAARDSVTLRGGPWWDVWLGRRDSLKASFDGANKFIPSPNSSLEALVSNFAQQGLNVVDLVALSGGHTIGKTRCTNFRNRIYNHSLEELHYDYYQRTTVFRRVLGSICPQSGRDNAIAPLDFRTPARFDNYYYRNLLEEKGLLHSDSVLLNEDVGGEVRRLVWKYGEDQDVFFASFAQSMVKMGNINVLVGHEGQIRRNCRFLNG
ncbi:unnamed protein product [Rhodiola kirilowii]